MMNEELNSKAVSLGARLKQWYRQICLPIFLFLAMTYVQLDCWKTGTLIYFPLFVGSRIVHAVAYIRAIQPLRNIIYLLDIFVLCSHIA